MLKMEGIQTLKGLWPWPWPSIRPYGIPSCIIIDLYLYTKFHSNWRNFLWTDGRTDRRTDGRTFFPSILLGRLSEVDLKMCIKTAINAWLTKLTQLNNESHDSISYDPVTFWLVTPWTSDPSAVYTNRISATGRQCCVDVNDLSEPVDIICQRRHAPRVWRYARRRQQRQCNALQQLIAA